MFGLCIVRLRSRSAGSSRGRVDREQAALVIARLPCGAAELRLDSPFQSFVRYGIGVVLRRRYLKMITRITGRLSRLGLAEAYFEISPYEHEVFVPDVVRRQLQDHIGEDVSLYTIEYIDGNVQKGGRMTPRLVGFLSPVEKEFFEMFCSVDGLGIKKALNAMNRPVADIAVAIEESDTKYLATLPGIGPAVADRVVAKLRRKMAKFALLIQADVPDRPSATRDELNDAYDALMALGHGPSEARDLVEQAAESLGKKNAKAGDLINEVYRLQRAANE